MYLEKEWKQLAIAPTLTWLVLKYSEVCSYSQVWMAELMICKAKLQVLGPADSFTCLNVWIYTYVTHDHNIINPEMPEDMWALWVISGKASWTENSIFSFGVSWPNFQWMV